MRNVFACITQEHDIRLVLLAALICLLASLTAFNLMSRGRRAPSPCVQWIWLTAAAVVSGCGVWATHFVAMLAYRPGLPLGYNIELTVLSVGIAVTIIWLGCTISLPGGRWAARGGAVAGAGIGAMHYTGMAALRTPADVIYDPFMVAVSLACGIVLGACAFYLKERRRDLGGDACAAGVFALAIIALHFTGMSAVTLATEMDLPVPDPVTSPEWLAVAVAAVTLMIIVLSLASSIIDQHLAERRVQETERLLREHVINLETTKQELDATGASLRAALSSAAASNSAKSQFLATMSHELRTPLNAVIGFAEMIGLEIYGPLGDRRYREYATNICDSGAYLLTLINDVLDFAKIDAGRLTLAEEEIEIPELFAATLRLVQGAAADAGLALRNELSLAELPRLRGDQRRVKQILLNLLSNAIKFTPSQGSVTIAAHRRGSELVITVSDTGIGIAASDLDKAIELFGQIDNPLTRARTGTGLGLPLCKQLIVLHGGTLSLASEVGHGTTATVTFPAERLVWPEASSGVQPAASAETHPTELQRPIYEPLSGLARRAAASLT